MNKGIVKFFNETKGFGFITETGTEKEYFVHASGLIDEIKKETKLSSNSKKVKKVFIR